MSSPAVDIMNLVYFLHVSDDKHPHQPEVRGMSTHPDLTVDPGTMLGEGKLLYRQIGAVLLLDFSTFSYLLGLIPSLLILIMSYHLMWHLFFLSLLLIVTHSSLGALDMAADTVETTIPDHQEQDTKVEEAACLMILGHPQGEDTRLTRPERKRRGAELWIPKPFLASFDDFCSNQFRMT